MNVETKKKFTVGSRCFFESFSDFKSKDLDELLIMDRPLFNKSKSFLMRVRDGRDIIKKYSVVSIRTESKVNH